MRGEIAFEPALRERVKLLAGLSESVIADVLRDRITLNPGARTLALTMRARGAESPSSPAAFASSPARSPTGSAPTRTAPTTLAIAGGRLTGKVIEPILGHNAKLGALRAIAAGKRP